MELFNRGAEPVSLAGWSVQYAAATGTGAWQVTPLGAFTLAPGGRYLVRQAGNANGVSPLPAPDAAGSTAMSATAGKVALVKSVAALAGACPASAALVDLVGYGASANCSESAPAPAPSATRAAFRDGDGCDDTDNNAADFTSAAPDPRNSSAPARPCAAAQTTTAGEPDSLPEWTLPPFDSPILSAALAASPAGALAELLPPALSAPRPSAGWTRWRRGAAASAPRGAPAARPRPPGAWP